MIWVPVVLVVHDDIDTFVQTRIKNSNYHFVIICIISSVSIIKSKCRLDKINISL